MLFLFLLIAQFVPPPSAGTGGLRTVSLYYSPAAVNMGGVGVSALQCSPPCGVPTAINSGTTVYATLNVVPATPVAVQGQFVLPTGYANSAITLEVMWETADTNTGHSATATFTSAQLAAAGLGANPTLANSTVVTLTPISTANGQIISTATFTPSWAAGNLIMWKAVLNPGTVTSDVQVKSVRWYATF